MEYQGSDGLVGLAILGRPRPSKDARPYPMQPFAAGRTMVGARFIVHSHAEGA